MIHTKSSSGVFSEHQRTNIRMSKLARTIQTAAAKSNWNEMAKLLFLADSHEGRAGEARKLRLINTAGTDGDSVASYGVDQAQYLLILMLIVSVAEKRTQELYERDFAKRCDAIAETHGLKDDQYWNDGKMPGEWEALTFEFERQSRDILLEVLQEYHQEEIAELVKSDGLEEFFSIVENVRAQFLKVLETGFPEEEEHTARPGSIPEILQPWTRLSRAKMNR